MNTRMPIGIEDFSEAKTKYYVVDKTNFIKQLIDNHEKVMLFTRPRRFGKTLTMSMLDYFFSIDRKKGKEDLFQGTSIEQAGPPYMQEKNKYPVIFISFKECCESSWEDMYEQITVQIQYEYQKHRYLLDGNILQPEEKALVQRFIERKADSVEYKRSLWYLSMYLSRYFNINPIVLIDEYDAPLQYAYANGFYDTAIGFFRRLFSSVLKGNDSLHFAVLTGVLRIAKESIFSGLNNLAVYSVLQQDYSDVFGFTAQEVKQMAYDLGYETKLDEIKQWYDGYSFGNHDVYNPWSVLSYFKAGGIAAAYWLNTSGNYILKQALQQANADRIQALQALLEGKSITTILQEGVIYNDIDKNNAAVYTILLMAGYLKATRTDLDIGGLPTYQLEIPNTEIKQVYTAEILANLGTDIQLETYVNFKKSLIQGQARKLTEQLQKILTSIVSFYDTSSPECFYHGLVLGMMCLMYDSDYQVVSNRESGYGRFDIALFPLRPEMFGIIMEFKVAASVEMLEVKAHEALQQIEDRQYITEFQQRGIQHVWKYGIAFSGKHVNVILE